MKKRLFIASVLLLGVIVGGIIGYRLFVDLPDLDSLDQHLVIPSVRITDRYGRLLYEVVDSTSGRHQSVALGKIPQDLQKATIATEDAGFYTNPGVDFLGIVRAIWIDLRGGETIAGGSTITQQVVRTLLMTPQERAQRSLWRKAREMILAWRLTRRLTKDDILALYLNQTYYGGMSYGVEAAAQTYFGESVSQLDLAECALLAGLPQAPALYNPFTAPEAARQRQSIVLGLMQSSGMITADQRSLAEREPLVFTETPYPIEAPHFVMMVRAQIDALFTPEQIYARGGLIVRTSLDLDWQYEAEAAIKRQIEALKVSEDGRGHNLHNAALLALNPHNGEVLALVGNPDYFDQTNGGAINMALAPRQPGSALKPVVYATALDPALAARRGDPAWTAATMLLDVRTSFLTHEGQAYTPQNYDMKEHGPVLVRQALASSLNIPAVLTLQHIGLKALFDQANLMGITNLTDPEKYDLSLALGGGEVRLLELTSVYGAFANGGYRVQPAYILDVRDLAGDLVYQYQPEPQPRILDERVAWLISDILSDNSARLIGFGPNSILRLDRPAAVKTGTTSNFHDNWTIGYTPDLVVGVWAGNTDYQPMMDVNGLTGAAPIWHQFMRSVLTGKAEQGFQRPEGLIQLEICSLSGLLPTQACPYRRWEWFIENTEPRQSDPYYREVTIDMTTGHLAGANTPLEQRKPEVVLNLPAQAWPWARSQGLVLLTDLLTLAGETDATGSLSQAPLQILEPAEGSLYRLAPGYAAQAQSLHLIAVGEVGLQEVTLWVDGSQVARLRQPPYEAWWPLVAGTHQAWAVAIRPDGSQITSKRVNFEVK